MPHPPFGPLAAVKDQLFGNGNPSYSILFNRIGYIDKDHYKDLVNGSLPRKFTNDQVAPTRAALERRRAALSSGTSAFVEVALEAVFALSVGRGISTPSEIGMSLLVPYGLPFIPGSALKGVTRRQMPKGSKYLLGKDAVKGGQSEPAAVAILDALPTYVEVEWDVINVHYQEYYSGGEPPADYWSPIPNSDLVVAPGSRFVTHVVGDDSSEVAIVRDVLIEAVDELGVGGLTASGFGYMAEVET